MSPRGKLLAIEGIDGAGKRTQIALLSRLLARQHVPHVRISFPRYQSVFGGMVGRFLNGEFGPLERVDPHFSALLFAGDRLEARPELEKALRAGKLVIADRYIASNLAHQTARVVPARRGKFLAWLRHVEYKVYGLPAEDLVVYLRVPARVGQQLVSRKAARDYTRLRKDIQEANLLHLEQAARVYDRLARARNWVTVECFDSKRGRLRTEEEIHNALVRALRKRAPGIFRPRAHWKARKKR